MESSLKITFIMPRTGEWAAGGLRTIYQFANHLTRRGHSLTIVHPGRFVIDPTPLDRVKNWTRYLLKSVKGDYTPAPWMHVEPSVGLTCVPTLSERHVPDADVVFATAWQTAEMVATYPKSKGVGLYFIQHLETWNGPAERVYATWKLPLKKVVPSRWLEKIGTELDEECVYIPNGLDTGTFWVTTPPADRNPAHLMMLYHTSAWKGCDDGLTALGIVREQVPELAVTLFGVPPRPDGLPEWIEYHQSPKQDKLRELYNRASIFVAPSHTEGWGLTGCEALLCGASLVATDIDGHREFAFHETTALTSPAKDPQSLASNILRLVRDAELRLRLAENGNQFVRQLTWERATDSLEGLLNQMKRQDPCT